jgi:hypothetical protein
MGLKMLNLPTSSQMDGGMISIPNQRQKKNVKKEPKVLLTGSNRICCQNVMERFFASQRTLHISTCYSISCLKALPLIGSMDLHCTNWETLTGLKSWLMATHLQWMKLRDKVVFCIQISNTSNLKGLIDPFINQLSRNSLS